MYELIEDSWYLSSILPNLGVRISDLNSNSFQCIFDFLYEVYFVQFECEIWILETKNLTWFSESTSSPPSPQKRLLILIICIIPSLWNSKLIVRSNPTSRGLFSQPKLLRIPTSNLKVKFVGRIRWGGASRIQELGRKSWILGSGDRFCVLLKHLEMCAYCVLEKHTSSFHVLVTRRVLGKNQLYYFFHMNERVFRSFIVSSRTLDE